MARRRRLEWRHRSSCCQTNAASNPADGEILEVGINPNNAADIRETTAHEMDDNTEKDHRRADQSRNG